MQESGIANPGIFARLWNSVLTSPRPTMGCEISQTGVSIARWSRIGSSLDVAAWRPVAPGAIEASPLRENLHDEAAVHKAFQESLSSLGVSSAESSRGLSNIVLVVPDQSARLFVLDFEKLPRNHEEGLSLVRWRLKKSLPFDVDTAAISYFVQKPGGSTQVVAIASPKAVVRQYEAVPLKFGLRPTIVIPSSLAALQLTSRESYDNASGRDITGAGKAADRSESPGMLFIKYSPPWFTTTILQNGILRLFRTVNLIPDADGTLSPEAVLGAVYPSIVYFQDSFHANVGDAYACGIGENSSAVAAALDSDLGLRLKFMATDSASLLQGVDPHPAERYFSALLGMAREQ